MSEARAPKLRKFLYRNLVDKADPDVRSTKEPQYRFSDGRVFTKNKTRNRTA